MQTIVSEDFAEGKPICTEVKEEVCDDQLEDVAISCLPGTTAVVEDCKEIKTTISENIETKDVDEDEISKPGSIEGDVMLKKEEVSSTYQVSNNSTEDGLPTSAIVKTFDKEEVKTDTHTNVNDNSRDQCNTSADANGSNVAPSSPNSSNVLKTRRDRCWYGQACYRLVSIVSI